MLRSEIKRDASAYSHALDGGNFPVGIRERRNGSRSIVDVAASNPLQLADYVFQALATHTLLRPTAPVWREGTTRIHGPDVTMDPAAWRKSRVTATVNNTSISRYDWDIIARGEREKDWENSYVCICFSYRDGWRLTLGRGSCTRRVTRSTKGHAYGEWGKLTWDPDRIIA